MNEKGFASLTALAILLVLAYLIRGTDYTAGLFVDMTNNFEMENRLRLVAESVLAQEIMSFDGKTVDEVKSRLQSTANPYTPSYDLPDGVDGVTVEFKILPDDELILLVIVKQNGYFNGQFGAFSSVGGFFYKNAIQDADNNDIYEYKFKGYLHRGKA